VEHVAFVINPFSKDGKYQNFVSELRSLLHEPKIFISRSKEDTQDFIRQQWQKTDIFVAVGGDGTISSVAAQLAGTHKILAAYPMGSGNGFARENGFGKDVKALVRKLENVQSKTIDAIKINGIFSINVSGVGFDGAVAHSFEKTVSRGFFNYILATVKTFFRFKDIQVDFLNRNYQKLNGKYLMLNIANTRQFGNNAFIAPHAKLDDGKADIALVRKFPLYAAPGFALDLFRGKLRGNPYVQYISDSAVTFEVDSDQWHIDGDVVSIKSPVHMEVWSQCIRILK